MMNGSLTRKTLGDEFISPEDLADKGVCRYTPEQISELYSRLPDQTIIKELQQTRTVLFAGPSRPLSLKEVRRLFPGEFRKKGPAHDNPDWFDVPKEVFASRDKVQPLQWIAVSLNYFNESTLCSWTKQRSLVVDPFDIPNAAEMTWAMCLYVEFCGTFLFDHFWDFRTSSVNARGQQVIVGSYLDTYAIYFEEKPKNESGNSTLCVGRCRRF